MKKKMGKKPPQQQQQQDAPASSPSPPHPHRHRRVPHLLLPTKRTLPLIIFFLFLLSLLHAHWQTLTYTLRPLWDTPPRPFHHIAHFYANGIPIPHLCSLHGWTPRPSPRRVFDAVIFNNELDLLEIRWRELLPFATKLVLIESNSTFTGQAKPLWFSQNAHRFAFAEPHMVYEAVAGRPLERGEGPFALEYMQRVAMDKVLREKAGIEEGDLLIMADVDEIPSAHTVDLLRWCDGIPPVMHLEMSNYLYSFEFMTDRGSWRSSAHLYRPGVTEYDHGRQADVILADAGWHCSFCFRYVEDIVFKMTAYSHADRVKSPRFLDYGRVQDSICRGVDLFDMLPEAYTFQELVSKLGAVPRSFSAVNLPELVLRKYERFKFLLPGNCVRERQGRH